MKMCKVKPPYNTCSACIDIQIEYNVIEDCSKCHHKTKEYELLSTGVSFLGSPYAIVQSDGKAQKVALNRVYDIKEATDGNK